MRLQLTTPGATICIMKQQKTLYISLHFDGEQRVDAESWILEASSYSGGKNGVMIARLVAAQ